MNEEQKNIIFFSLIIPFNNCEKYIERCLDSILSQTYKNIEILLIDDGSIDNGLKICKKYSDKDKRIRIFSISNHGVSYARNIGIENAKGKYLLFIDADDFLLNRNSLNDIQRNIGENDDVIAFNYKILNEENKVFKKNNLESKSLLYKSGFDYIDSVLEKNPNMFWYIWKYAYNKSIIDKYKILFPIDINYHEDLYFVNNVLIHSSNVKNVNLYVYCYVKHRQSITTRKDKEIYSNRIKILERIILETLSNKSIPIKTKNKMINNFLCTLIGIINELDGLNKKEVNEILIEISKFNNYYKFISTNRFKLLAIFINIIGINNAYYLILLRKKILNLIS